MDEPILENVYEIFFPFEKHSMNSLGHLKTLKSTVIPFIEKLEKFDLIKWYSFLIHECPKNQVNYFCWHLRFSLINVENLFHVENILDTDFNNLELCISKDNSINEGKIAGINKEILLNNDIRKAWLMLGNLSEFTRNLVQYQDFQNINEFVKNSLQQFHFLDNQLQFLFSIIQQNL